MYNLFKTGVFSGCLNVFKGTISTQDEIGTKNEQCINDGFTLSITQPSMEKHTFFTHVFSCFNRLIWVMMHIMNRSYNNYNYIIK
jgi:hypothetical protein